MPVFRLTLPGIEFVSPAPLDIVAAGGTASTVVQARLVDGLLYQPPGTSLRLEGRFDAQSATLRLTGDFTARPARFLDGQLEVQRFDLQIRVMDDPTTGEKVLDANAPNPVSMTGEADWISAMIQSLGIANGRLPFDLGYTFQRGGQSGFTLALRASPANPIAAPRLAIDLQQGRLAVDVLPDELAMIITLAGDAAMQTNGTFGQQVRQILETIFGAGNAPDLDPPPFLFRRKFRLEPTGLPGAPLELPSFSLAPLWRGGQAPALPAFPDLQVSLGSPRFTFQLPDPAALLPELGLALRDCAIRLPALPGMDAIRLAGNLNFVRQTGGFTFNFEPSLSGGVALPEVLRFFLDQIAWLAGQLPELDQIADLLRLSQAELDWNRLFQDLATGLTPTNFDPVIFRTTFRAILDGAAAAINAPDIDRLFRLAFRIFQQIGDQAFRVMWEVWFDLTPTDWDKLVKLLQASLPDFDQVNYAALLDQLFSLAGNGLVLVDFLRAALELGAAQLQANFDSFMKMWLHIFSAISRSIAPADFAAAVFELFKNVSPALDRFMRLSDIPVFHFDNRLTGPLLTLRVDVLLVGLGLQGIVRISTLEQLALAYADSKRFIEYLLRPVFAFFNVIFPTPAPVDATQVLALLTALFTNAEGDEESEILLLQLSRFYLLGVIFALVGAAWNAVRPSHLLPWFGLVFQPIEDDSSLKVLRLPAPKATGTPIKYLILSDIHRDARSDDRGLFIVGSIDHFSEHSQLYLDILNHADKQGYTVIEAGDGEELWYIRDFSSYRGPAEHLEEILVSHASIYAKLADMYQRGKYLRMIGNHDSYLRRPAVFSRLQQRFPASDPAGRPFTLYDYIIIDGVKTMDERGLGDLLGHDIWDGLTEEDKFKTIIDNVARGRLGLDSHPYAETKPMIVTHGHQWDFWNCDKNNLVGKIISNAIGVPVDQLNDPFNDLAGLAFAGSPAVDFQDFLARLPVFDNFPAYQPALAAAHQVQHMPDKERVLINGWLYWEILPALVSMFAMPLHLRNDSGNITQRWSQVLNDQNTRARFFDHLMNQICIGHTHNPQAQPYFDIEKLVAGPLDPIVKGVRQVISDALFGWDPSLNVVKSRYYNSGTSGWMSGVIWAIEINEFAEARLVYWSKDGRIDRPQTMDWQLPRQDDAWRAALAAKQQDVVEYWRQVPELVGDSAVSLLQAMGSLAGLPLSVLVAFADELAGQSFEFQLQALSALSTSSPGAPELGVYLQQQTNQVGQWLVVALLSTLRRQAGAPGSLPPQRLTLRVPLPADLEQALNQITGVLKTLPFPGVTATQIDQSLTQMACVWLLASQASGLANRTGRLHFEASTHPVAFLAFSLAALLPGAAVSDLPFTSQVTIDNHQLVFTLMVN